MPELLRLRRLRAADRGGEARAALSGLRYSPFQRWPEASLQMPAARAAASPTRRFHPPNEKRSPPQSAADSDPSQDRSPGGREGPRREHVQRVSALRKAYAAFQPPAAAHQARDAEAPESLRGLPATHASDVHQTRNAEALEGLRPSNYQRPQMRMKRTIRKLRKDCGSLYPPTPEGALQVRAVKAERPTRPSSRLRRNSR